jgi:hypothetical protein
VSAWWKPADLEGSVITEVRGDDLYGIQEIRVVTPSGTKRVIWPHCPWEDTEILYEDADIVWRNHRGYPAVKP